jgi:sensor c-di-GMP phosphodiesterase-like protein
MHPSFLSKAGIILCGAALGLSMAHVVVRTIQLHEGRSELQRYAAVTLKSDEDIAAEASEAIRQVEQDHLPFCSDNELSFMRSFVFRSAHVRDLGRVKDGKLYCSAALGRLPKPTPTAQPTLTVGNQKIYVHAKIALSGGGEEPELDADGVALEIGTVSAVMNPIGFFNPNRLPGIYSGLLFDRAGHRAMPVLGETAPLTSDEVIAGKYLERGGIFYQPLCSKRDSMCAVVGLPRADMLAQSRPMGTGLLIGGGLLGSALGLIAIQTYLRHRSIENQLRRAIRKRSLTLVYQPVVDLQTGAMVGAEALVRWVNEHGDPVHPEVFVALAEQQHFVNEITHLVLQRAVGELHDLLLGEDFVLTVNIASHDLADPSFFAALQETLTTANVPPSSVGLELTERSATDKDASVDAIAKLKTAGHPMYIDDFGTGFSSLAYLHELDVDGIKIDQVFTQSVGTEAVTASVVPQILAMAAQLDLLVIVEGIETREQANYFSSAGRGVLGQGWLFGKPLPADAFRDVYFKQKLDAAAFS